MHTCDLSIPYKIVNVLLICWEDTTQHEFENQLDTLASEFKKFNFCVRKYKIASKRPQQKLNRELLSFLDNDQDDTLLIIYYGGHGLNNSDKECIWLRDDPISTPIEYTPQISWSALQSLFLYECVSHVLFILDCCYSSSLSLSADCTSTVEAIVACGFETVTPLRGEDSFTTFLISQLEQIREKGELVYANRLCGRVNAELNRTQGNRGRRVTPLHIPFSNQSCRIRICPLPSKEVPCISTNRILQPEGLAISESGRRSLSLRSPRSQMIQKHKFSLTSFPRQLEDSNGGYEAQKPATTPATPDREASPPSSESGYRLHRVTTLPAIITSACEASPPPSQSDDGFDGGVPSSDLLPHIRTINFECPCLDVEHLYDETPLENDEIRVLRLFPCEDSSEPIECSFLVEKLPRSDQDVTIGSYKALSGLSQIGDSKGTDSKGTISMHSSKTSRIYPLAASTGIVHALTQLRDPEEPVSFWVEIICINSLNPKEQSRQLEKIPGIFQSAKEAIAWLGEGDEDIRSAMNFIPRLLDLNNVDALVVDDDTTRQWEALINLLDRPYFRRRWNFLEILLARRATLHCGDCQIPWGQFCDAVVVLGSRYDDIQLLLRTAANSSRTDPRSLLGRSANDMGAYHTIPAHLIDPRALAAYSMVQVSRELFNRNEDGSLPEKCSLETLVSMLPAMQSAEPRAVIWALVPIASDGRKWLSSCQGVDLSSADKVYQKFIQHCFQESKSINIICRPWAPRHMTFERRNTSGNTTAPSSVVDRNIGYGTLPITCKLPSWIRQVDELPFGDGHQGGRRNGEIFVGHPGNPSPYDACNGTTAEAIFGMPSSAGETEFDGKVTVSGFRVSPIFNTMNRASEGTLHKEWIALCNGKDDDESSVPDGFWRTLVADRGPEGMAAPLWYKQACRYWINFKMGHDIGASSLEAGHPSMALDYIKRVRSVIWNRVMFEITDYRGRSILGLGPENTAKGDIVCILNGCSVPVILRQKNDGWSLVGECFVYGLMDGEAMKNEAYTTKNQEFLML